LYTAINLINTPVGSIDTLVKSCYVYKIGLRILPDKIITMKTLIPKLLIVTSLLSIIYLSFSCRKNTPEPPPPVDSTQVVDLKKGLLLYLPFTGNFADSSGNNNPTVGVGGASLGADQNGTPSSALDGGGNGQRVVVTNNGSIKFDSAYTVSLNVMLRSFQRSSFFDMVKDATGDGWVFGVGTDVGNTNVINFNTVDTTGNCSTTVQPSNSQLLHSKTPIQPYTWYNIVSVFYKGVSKIYINGQLDASLTTTNNHVPVCMSSNLTVGGWWSGDPTSINGKLDEVRLYNRALNMSEISKLAQGFPAQVSSTVADLRRGLMLYLPFNGSLADSSGNNNPVQKVGGGGLTYDEHGYANSAYNSTGGAALLVTNNGSIKFDTAYTVSLSVMMRTSQLQIFMSMVDFATGHSPIFNLGTNVQGANNFKFATNDVTEACGTWGDPTAPQQVRDTTSFIPQVESWYNIVCIYHRGTGSVYVNGQLVGTSTSTGTLAKFCSDAQVVIGGWWSVDPESLDGKIDNVRMYNRVLIPEEIAMLATHYQPTSNSIRQTISH